MTTRGKWSKNLKKWRGEKIVPEKNVHSKFHGIYDVLFITAHDVLKKLILETHNSVI